MKWWAYSLTILLSLSPSLEASRTTIIPKLQPIEITHETFGCVEAYKNSTFSQIKFSNSLSRLSCNLFSPIHKPPTVEESQPSQQLFTKNCPDEYLIRFYLPISLQEDIERLLESGAISTEVCTDRLKEITYLSNEVNLDTQETPPAGLIALTARYPATTKALTQSQVVFLKINLGKKDLLCVPCNAIHKDDRGNYVYVLKSKSYIEKRYIKRGKCQEDLCIVLDGLSTSDQVVCKS